MMTPQQKADNARMAMTMILDGCRMLIRGEAGRPDQIEGLSSHDNTVIYHQASITAESAYVLEWVLGEAVKKAKLCYPRYEDCYGSWPTPETAMTVPDGPDFDATARPETRPLY